MKKYLKWGLVALIILGAAVFGYFQLMPKENEELALADTQPKGGKKVLYRKFRRAFCTRFL